MEKEIAELEAHVGRTPDIVSAEKPKKKAPVEGGKKETKVGKKKKAK